jgi:biopolymer transport protein ExbB
MAFLGMMTILACAQEAPGVKEKTLMHLFVEGGWVMYPITLCSVAMIWFIIDGTIRTSAQKLYPASHVTQLRNS